MARAFREHAAEVTWLFSGRERSQLFDMEPFGDFHHRRGLTFATRAGRRAGVPTIGIGHQYAFGPDTPIAGDHWLAGQTEQLANALALSQLGCATAASINDNRHTPKASAAASVIGQSGRHKVA